MKFWVNDYFQLTIRLAIGAIFLYAGLGKILDPLGFASAIYNYKLFPVLIIGFIAVWLPWIEAVAGLSLIFGFKVKGGSFITTSLLVLFICLILVSAIRGLDVECGCFSGIERKVGFLAIAEDFIILAGSIFVFFLDQVKIKPYKLLLLLQRR